jgi:thiosulfate/3-mercaptopyruvate sulfurtransferase
MAGYAHPEALVTTQWVADHLGDPRLRVVEVDVDTQSYDEGHLRGSIGWNWSTQLCDLKQRDILSQPAFEQLMSEAGIEPTTTVVLHGDNNNWFAAWAFWQMKMYGHRDVRLMDGGRRKWLAEGRELTDDAPKPKRSQYRAQPADLSLRELLPDLREKVQARSINLVDVRSADEFSGKIFSPPGLPETCQRGGHIPGASSIPWGKVCNDDGTFKSVDELRALYAAQGIQGDRPIVAYCRIGERSSHSWFVLKYLLGYANVTNYDGSWTEWGNLVRAPIEK